jgi:hypothetical protein
MAAGEARDRAEAKLASIISELKKYYSPKEIEDFDRVNEAWLQYQRLDAEFVASEYEGGSIVPLIHASALESVAVTRIVELEVDLREKRRRIPYKGLAGFSEVGPAQTKSSGDMKKVEISLLQGRVSCQLAAARMTRLLSDFINFTVSTGAIVGDHVVTVGFRCVFNSSGTTGNSSRPNACSDTRPHSRRSVDWSYLWFQTIPVQINIRLQSDPYRGANGNAPQILS